MPGTTFKYFIFLVLIVIILVVAGTALTFTDFLVSNIFWLIVLFIFIYIAWKYDFIVQLVDYQRIVVYRFGKVNRVGGPGWAWLWPIIESCTQVDLRTKTIDVPKQDIVTKDSIELSVDAVIYLKVKKDNQSVVNSVIEVENYVEASKLYVVSALRDVLGSMPLSEVITNIELINAQVKEDLEKISKDWGVAVESVEIKDVQIPEIVLNAMHEEKAAVQQKLARMEKALAHKAEIDAVREAAAKLDDKALSYYYIKAIESMAKNKGSKVFFPAEFSNLAESFSKSKILMPRVQDKEKGETTKQYEKLLKEYVDSAVKKSSKKKSKNKQKNNSGKKVKKKAKKKK